MRRLLLSRQFSWNTSSLIVGAIFTLIFGVGLILSIFIANKNGTGFDALGYFLAGLVWSAVLSFTSCSLLGYRLNRDRNLKGIVFNLVLSWLLMLVGGTIGFFLILFIYPIVRDVF